LIGLDIKSGKGNEGIEGKKLKIRREGF
jgi:hypothetical protein